MPREAELVAALVGTVLAGGAILLVVTHKATPSTSQAAPLAAAVGSTLIATGQAANAQGALTAATHRIKQEQHTQEVLSDTIPKIVEATKAGDASGMVDLWGSGIDRLRDTSNSPANSDITGSPSVPCRGVGKGSCT